TRSAAVPPIAVPDQGLQAIGVADCIRIILSVYQHQEKGPVIRVGPTPPTPDRPFSDRPGSHRAVELLPRVLEALPVGIGLFELYRDDFRFRYGNRAFARVLMLDRMHADGECVDVVLRLNDHDALV